MEPIFNSALLYSHIKLEIGEEASQPYTYLSIINFGHINLAKVTAMKVHLFGRNCPVNRATRFTEKLTTAACTVDVSVLLTSFTRPLGRCVVGGL